MSNDEATLGSYGAKDLYNIHCIDKSWVHDFSIGSSDVQKFEISEDAYDKRKNNVRKWKEQMIKKNPKYQE